MNMMQMYWKAQWITKPVGAVSARYKLYRISHNQVKGLSK